MTATDSGPGRRWLIIFLASLVFALAVAGWKGWSLWRVGQPERSERSVPVGRTIVLGGSSYRVDAITARDRFPNQDPDEPVVRAPAGARIVLVTLTTEILDSSVDPRRHYCSATLRDDRDRTWQAGADIAYAIRRPEAVTCTGTSDQHIRPHRPLQVGFGFLVPADVVDRLVLDLELTSGDDYRITVTP